MNSIVKNPVSSRASMNKYFQNKYAMSTLDLSESINSDIVSSC